MSKLLFELDLEKTVIEPPMEVSTMVDICFPNLAVNDDWHKHYFDGPNLDDLPKYINREEEAALKIMLHDEVWELEEIVITMLFSGLDAMTKYYLEELSLPAIFTPIIVRYTHARAKYADYRLTMLVAQYKKCAHPELAALVVAASDELEMIKWFGSANLLGLRRIPKQLSKIEELLTGPVDQTTKTVKFILTLASKKAELEKLTSVYTSPTVFVNSVSALLKNKFNQRDIDILNPKIIKLWIISFCVRVYINKDS